ncbi:uncharacterized protein NECHADRAFT_88708 [Fusarium vanettenii 77-13-4]|uniref:Uncharacterized protein n=1 Tax=Fusarium vanettenii (strain ATCC MYA-4622 / CBS 123669 / FGSC 9596 / NRRL 45880 / 77-13-4) TaxID=660122 RepID=C7ZNC7_FUSV7|nr:uncharacterized protein NECHADRAFT_88708 [Fusarium vanettenii 77-13-4]EEU34471.1 predicted protein [Fusarium vanettenii 77-13-4]
MTARQLLHTSSETYTLASICDHISSHTIPSIHPTLKPCSQSLACLAYSLLTPAVYGPVFIHKIRTILLEHELGLLGDILSGSATRFPADSQRNSQVVMDYIAEDAGDLLSLVRLVALHWLRRGNGSAD